MTYRTKTTCLAQKRGWRYKCICNEFYYWPFLHTIFDINKLENTHDIAERFREATVLNTALFVVRFSTCLYSILMHFSICIFLVSFLSTDCRRFYHNAYQIIQNSVHFPFDLKDVVKLFTPFISRCSFLICFNGIDT